MKRLFALLLPLKLLIVLSLTGCNNSPYPDGAAAENTLYTAFSGNSPRYLDPTSSYSSNETPYTYQIYEPLYGYHYLKRPYELIPKTAVEVAQPRYLDAQGRELPAGAPVDQIAESVYDIRIKPGIRFAPHPAFARDEQGRLRYHALKAEELGKRRSPWDFEHQGTRELVAEDYVYAIKRHATTRTVAPVFGKFAEYVVGLEAYGKRVREEDKKLRAGLPATARDKPFLDFRQWPLEGAQALDSHTLRIRIKGKYPQWSYWLAMTFLAPIPWEADAFYAQPGMADNGLSLNTWPVGTGPYMMWAYQQDRRHVLKRNPHYRGEPYPCEGTQQDRDEGRLADCGKTMPFIDTLVFTIEKEGVSQDAKFRQGYLDVPEFDQMSYGNAYKIQTEDSDRFREEFERKGIVLARTVDLSVSYLAFNWLDPVVGQGDTPEQRARNRKLRQALSIAIDWDEFNRLFPRAAGEVAHGPLPGGVFGSRHGSPQGINPVTHHRVNGLVVRRGLEEARRLMAEAGYPDGRDARTGRPLVLNYDYGRPPSPENRPMLDWMTKQFAKLGVQLEVRATDYNQFQDKVRRGKHQIITWGWLADYPDAENFLFLLYGPGAKSINDGENAANYQNPEYDRLFARLRFMEDGPEKQAVIDQMVKILQEDAPWSWGYFPYASGAYHHWVKNGKPSIMVRDQGQYKRLNVEDRARSLAEWNRPVYWPLAVLLAVLVAMAWGARSVFRARERQTGRVDPLHTSEAG
ncbi:peptide ABC transporter substrate-binding protein [Aquabacterium fontiphilum]|jgi:ABC-type transport system substrate-binding protein|uniref:ABC transporter substrate-binding protein n=1 Tax=Aquabacterium fontiphilum TaxID=450365 RepID=UPI001376FEB5|nr:ABC transporter substrate-binding protein [Aquabacterium fontiphilum]NBD19901.1 peptide ABC transporter substrate-binding protein [Aquabacterium fontiphilum]